MAVTYNDLVMKGQTVYNTKTGQGYSSEAQLAQDLGVAALPQNWHTTIARNDAYTPTNQSQQAISQGLASPVNSPTSTIAQVAQQNVPAPVQYSDLVNRGGAIYNAKTGQGYSNPTQLAQAMGIDASTLDWNNQYLKDQNQQSQQAISQGLASPVNLPTSTVEQVVQQNTANQEYRPGDLIRPQGSIDVYYIDDKGNKVKVTDPSQFNNVFGANRWSTIKPIDSATFNQLGDAGTMTNDYFTKTAAPVNGATRINPQTGKQEVYDAATGQYKPAPSLEINTDGTLKSGTLATGGTTLSGDIQQQIADASLIKSATGPEIYRIEQNNVIRHIQNEKVFTNLGYDWNSVKTVTPEILGAYTKGTPITELVASYEKAMAPYKAFMEEAKLEFDTSKEKEEIKTYKDKILDSINKIPDLITGAFDTPEIRQKKTDLTKINADILAMQQEEELALQKAGSRKAGMTFIRGEQGQIQKAYDTKLKYMYAQQAAISGDLTQATQYAKDWSTAQIAAEQAKIQALQIGLSEAIDAADDKDKERIAAVSAAATNYSAQLEQQSADSAARIKTWVDITSKYGLIEGLSPIMSVVEQWALAGPVAAKQGAKNNIMSAQGGLYDVVNNKWIVPPKPSSGSEVISQSTLNKLGQAGVPSDVALGIQADLNAGLDLNTIRTDLANSYGQQIGFGYLDSFMQTVQKTTDPWAEFMSAAAAAAAAQNQGNSG